MNTRRVDTKIIWVHGGHRRVRLHVTKIVNMLRLGCNTCQNSFLDREEEKFNYMKFIQCFVLQIEVVVLTCIWGTQRCMKLI